MGAALIVIDGDTIRSDEERIRLEGIDAAEIGHAKCEAERRLGALAKHRLEQLLDSGTVDIRRNTPIPQTATAAHSPACWSTARMWDAS
jgi:micrococcal nuclease